MHFRFNMLATVMVIFGIFAHSYGQQVQYSCLGILYPYPYSGCTYNTNNNGYYGGNNGYNNNYNTGYNNNNQVRYLCNGQYYSYPYQGCTYNNGIYGNSGINYGK